MDKIELEVSAFLKGTPTEKTVRGKRALPIAAAVAGAVVSIVTEITFFASNNSVMKGFLAPVKTTARNVENLGSYAIAL